MAGNFTKQFICLFSLVVACLTTPFSGISADETHKPATGSERGPGSFPNGNISVSAAALAAGFESSWDTLGISLFCILKADTVILFPDRIFVTVNRIVFQLPVAPKLSHGVLTLPGPVAVTLFNPFCANRLRWQASQNSVVFESTEDDSTITAPGIKNNVPANGKSRDTGKPARSSHETISVIVVDPGHGGKDPGAIGPTGIQEKDVVLGIALELRNLLKNKGDCTIFMTREKDVFIPLRNRTKLANDKKADLFISIHANSIAGSKQKKNEARGFKSYFLSQAKNEEDKLAAMTENSVVELEDRPQEIDFLQNIIVEMMNNEYLTESQDLSILIAESFGTTVKKIPKLHLGVGQAPFWVLNGAYMPSVLVETAFISHLQEEKLLADPIFQKKIALAIFDAVVTFKKKYRSEHE